MRVPDSLRTGSHSKGAASLCILLAVVGEPVSSHVLDSELFLQLPVKRIQLL